MANRERDFIHIWRDGYLLPDRNISGNFDAPLSLFVTYDGTIFLDNGISFARVDRWQLNDTTGTTIMNIPEECYSIFIDTSNHIYCAATAAHQIVKKWLGDNGTLSVRIAGNGVAGSTSSMLHYPAGVFVDHSFRMYVGDCGNNRVQMFLFGQPTATTVAGDGAPGTVTLWCPNGVALDANGYLFISDTFGNRFFAQGPLGFRCLFGCTGVAGSSSTQLYYPRTFSFDSYGNIFITDQINYRIQKFLLVSNSCSEYSF